MLQRSIKSVLEITGQSSVAWQSLEGPTGTQGRRTFLPPPQPLQSQPQTHPEPTRSQTWQAWLKMKIESLLHRGNGSPCPRVYRGLEPKLRYRFTIFTNMIFKPLRHGWWTLFGTAKLCGQLAMSWPVLPTSPPKQSCQPPVKMCHEQRNKN